MQDIQYVNSCKRALHIVVRYKLKVKQVHLFLQKTHPQGLHQQV
jgi:hypothetical protein